VQLWSLTDHDELAGQQRARDAALALGMDYLAGTEISVSFAGETVHIVGLGVDPENPELVAGLAATRAAAGARALQMAEGLAQAGIPGVFEGALRYVGNPDLISRTHFARYMVEAGVCDDTHAVFRSYLTQGNPGYVPHQWARLGDAVRWIVEAGGVAVIAHPARYKFSANVEYALFTEFMAHGGAASKWSPAATATAIRSATRKPRASSACWPHAAATSTPPAKAAPNWAPCPTCPAR
jgi:predicted metal-dependent phosphoesterase TrpH